MNIKSNQLNCLPGKFLSGVYRLLNKIREKSLFIQTLSKEDPGQRPAGMTSSFGFTLIELLVVVLIIGILSAVALPQYEVSVLKTHYANLTLLAETYFKAAQATQLAIGEWPDSFDVLDVSLPGGSIEATPAAGHCGKFKDSYCCLLTGSGNYQSAGISCGLQNYRLGVAIFANSNGTIMYKECFAKANDSAANQVCKGMATYAGTGNGHNMPGPTGHIIGMNGYQY